MESDHEAQRSQGHRYLTPVVLTILAMGVSRVIVVILCPSSNGEVSVSDIAEAYDIGSKETGDVAL